MTEQGQLIKKHLFFGFIKPDSYEQCDKILGCFLSDKISVVDRKTVIATGEQLEQHYIEHKDKDFYQKIIDEIKGRKIELFVLSGDENIIIDCRKIIKKVIRPEFSLSFSKNACHGSDSEESVRRETLLWFGEDYVKYLKDKYFI